MAIDLPVKHRVHPGLLLGRMRTMGVVADHPAAASPRVVSGTAGHPRLRQIAAAATSSTARTSQIHGICDASIPTASTRTTPSIVAG
jgi:hypothetical protein